MREYFPLAFIFCLIFASISYAENDATFRDLQIALGTLQAGYINNKMLSEIPENEAFKTQMWYPSKLDAFQKYERVEIVKIGNDKWKIQNPKTGGMVEFSVSYESGKLKITKTESYIVKDTEISASPKRSSGELQLRGTGSIGARVSYVDPSDDDYKYRFGIEVDVEPDSTAMYGVNGAYFFSNYFSIEFSADYLKTSIDLSGTDLSGISRTGDAGDVKSIPLLFTGRFSVPIKNRALPYFGGGFGYFFNDFDQNDRTIEYLYGPGADVDIDNSWGFLVNAGIDFFFTPNVALNFDFKYIWNEVEIGVDGASFPTDDEKFDLNMMVVGGGLKYYF